MPLPEYTDALKNPLMGISPTNYSETYGSYQTMRGLHPWGTLSRSYVPWSWLENNENDGIEKIRAVTDQLFSGVENYNIKLMPRVYLYWPGGLGKDKARPFYLHWDFWPADMKTDDYTSEQFKSRVTRLVARLGEVWDNDPRVGFIEMGIQGKWGEQSDPQLTPEMEKVLGDAFSTAFKHKKIMTRVRPTTNFDAYPFGLLWDSFAHQDQLALDGKILENSQKWKVGPIGGEPAYDWGHYKIQPGDAPPTAWRTPSIGISSSTWRTSCM